MFINKYNILHNFVTIKTKINIIVQVFNIQNIRKSLIKYIIV